MFSSYNQLIIYFVLGVYMDVFVSPVMCHVLLSYSTVLKWLLPICIVIIMIVFILVVFVLYTEVLCLSFFFLVAWLRPACSSSIYELQICFIVVLLPLLLVFTTF